ncbi:MAG: protein kinase, partial [bacterium]
VVYKAEDTKLKRDVAIKFLPRQIAASEEDRERFKIEAQAAAALNHPNIATIHAIEEHDDEMFIVMEYIEGRELKSTIDDRQLSIVDVLDTATQIAAGLRAAHKKGVVHRDIKSANIMITEEGQVKIMDFGLAKIGRGAQLTKAHSTLGTAAYMSPEQARGEAVDHRSDIWSVGVVLYEMLTGKHPFPGDYEQAVIYSILNEEPEPIAQLRPETPETLRHIVEKALQKKPAARYVSSGELCDDLKTLASAKTSPAGGGSLSRLLRKPAVAVPVILLVVGLVALVSWRMDHATKVRRARLELLPQIEALVEKMQGTERKQAWAAFELMQQVETVIPDEPLLAQLRPKIVRARSIDSRPQGARVFAKAYADSGQAWHFLGQTPLDRVPFPLGCSRIRVEKDGYRTFYDLIWNASWFSDTLRYELAQAGSVPEEMEFVPSSATWFDISAAPAGLHMPGLEQHAFVPVGDFLMDRNEVTNREYQRFVDAGGYQNRAYWKHPFRKDGRELTWKEAMAFFVDKTGQPGPATWEVGDFLEGEAAYPVTGVSWYEAAAYAEFAGKSLPTVYHWDRVAFTWASPAIVPFSNLTAKGLLPVGESNSMNRFGIFDLAGNVREWCVNQSSRGGRFILGGGWNDPAYAFNDAYAQSAFDRSATNGLRCIRYLQGEANHADLEQ